MSSIPSSTDLLSEATGCPVCRSQNALWHGEENGYRLRRCASCQTGFIRPIATDEQLRRLAALPDGLPSTAKPERDETAPAARKPGSNADVKAERAVLRKELSKSENRLAEAEAELSQLRSITGSTTWRIASRLLPLLRPLGPMIAAAHRSMAAGRAAIFNRRRRGDMNPGATRRTLPDPILEICRIPEWDEASGRFRLRVDEARLAQLRAAPAERAGLAAPYVVTPLTPVPQHGRRPKILHVIPNVFVGGSTQLIIDIMQHLSHRYEQEVLTSALWRGGEHVGMRVQCVPKPDPKDMRKIYRAYAPDIVHVHYWGLTDDAWYKAAFRALDAIPEASVVENINTPIAPMVTWHVDHYVYVSEYVRSTFGSGANGPENSSVIYPGIDLARFSKPYDGPDARNSIGMVYRLEDDKLNLESIELFIEVVKRRPRTRVLIIGGGSFLPHYIARTIDEGVRENFWFTGYVPYDTLPGLYDEFSVFVAPVWKESFGQVSPFAMAKGLAVAGYAIGALPEIVGRRESFAETLPETAGIIVNLLDDPERLDSEGARNRIRAQELFSVEAMVDRYDRLYAKLAS